MAAMLMRRLAAGARVPALRQGAMLGGASTRVAAGGAQAVNQRRGFADMPTPPPGYRAKLACLDLEGVLIPEVWVNLAERVGVEELKRTTRDEPVYEKLMRYRLDIMKREGLTIHDINAAIESMEPFPGAPEFVEVSGDKAVLCTARSEPTAMLCQRECARQALLVPSPKALRHLLVYSG